MPALMTAFKANKLVPGLLFAFAAIASGQVVPKDYVVPTTTLSPNRRFGVLVPIAYTGQPDREWGDGPDTLIDMKSGRRIAELQGDTGYDHALNFLEVRPSRWSSDGSLLLWEVAGKWCPSALDLVKVSKWRADWQINLLQMAQQAILAYTKQAAPKQYAVCKKASVVDGVVYPDGFTIDVTVAGPVKLPLHVQSTLTADPKLIESAPNLDSELEGVVVETGKFIVTEFHIERGASSQH